jgi:hypothetical protein
MWPKMTAGRIRPSSVGTPTPPRVTTADALIALIRAIPFLPPSPPQFVKRGKHTQKKGIAPVEKLSVPLYVFVPDREPDFLTDSHVKLDIFADTQVPLSTSHHKIAFKYDEGTVSLVVGPTLSTLDMSISDNSNSSAGNASAFEYYECYEVKDNTPQLNYHRPKIKIPKQESPVTICTTDTSSTMRK